jgi:hypothetical protein
MCYFKTKRQSPQTRRLSLKIFLSFGISAVHDFLSLKNQKRLSPFRDARFKFTLCAGSDGASPEHHFPLYNTKNLYPFGKEVFCAMEGNGGGAEN